MQKSGIYDAECTQMREATGATAVALVVIGGEKGDGVSIVQTDPKLHPMLPGLLRGLAGQIDAGIGATPQEKGSSLIHIQGPEEVCRALQNMLGVLQKQTSFLTDLVGFAEIGDFGAIKESLAMQLGVLPLEILNGLKGRIIPEDKTAELEGITDKLKGLSNTLFKDGGETVH